MNSDSSDPYGQRLQALKWLALVCMVADHVDVFLFGQSLGLSGSVGRLAMPLFLWVLVAHVHRSLTSEDGQERARTARMLWRMMWAGLLAWPAHWMLLREFLSQPAGMLPLNIMFSLALAVLMLWAVSELVVRWRHAPSAWTAVLAVAVPASLIVDYAWWIPALAGAMWGMVWDMRRCDPGGGCGMPSRWGLRQILCAATATALMLSTPAFGGVLSPVWTALSMLAILWAARAQGEAEAGAGARAVRVAHLRDKQPRAGWPQRLLEVSRQRFFYIIYPLHLWVIWVVQALA